MIGHIGQPRRVPNAPSASAVQAALELMVSLGSDNKAAQRLLTDLKSAIKHNTCLVADATAKLKALETLERREAALAEMQIAVDKKLAEIDGIRSEFGKYEKTLP